mgnify:CR=1 FL=1
MTDPLREEEFGYRLATFASQARSRELSTDVVLKTKIHIIDTLAAIVSGAALEAGARWIALRSDRLPKGFLDLSTGVAGEIAQKCVNYGVGLAVLGDLSAAADRSASLRDWMREKIHRRGHIADAPVLFRDAVGDRQPQGTGRLRTAGAGLRARAL